MDLSIHPTFHLLVLPEPLYDLLKIQIKKFSSLQECLIFKLITSVRQNAMSLMLSAWLYCDSLDCGSSLQNILLNYLQTEMPFTIKNKHTIWGWGCSLMIEYLPSMHETVGFISTIRNITRTTEYTTNRYLTCKT
jgi:hypothetical protein